MTFRISTLFAGFSGAFHAIAMDLENAGAAVLKAAGPSLSAMVDKDVAVAKQMASDAISWADGVLASHQQAIAMATEQQLDTELALITGGASVPFNKFTNDGVDSLVAAAVSAAHNWGLQTKAALALPPMPAPATQVMPDINALGSGQSSGDTSHLQAIAGAGAQTEGPTSAVSQAA